MEVGWDEMKAGDAAAAAPPVDDVVFIDSEDDEVYMLPQGWAGLDARAAFGHNPSPVWVVREELDHQTVVCFVLHVGSLTDVLHDVWLAARDALEMATFDDRLGQLVHEGAANGVLRVHMGQVVPIPAGFSRAVFV